MTTKTCPTCKGSGKVAPGYKAERDTAGRSWFVYNQAEQPTDAIGPVYIPRAHARDFGGTLGVIGVGLCGLLGGTIEQCVYTGILSAATVFGIVRAMGTLQDNKRVDRRDRMASGVTLHPQAAPAPTPSDNGGYLPVHSAPKADRRAALRDFVRGCEQVGTKQNYWETTRGMDRGKYQELRDLLIGLGWAGWKSKKSTKPGWELLFTAVEIETGLLRGTMRDGSYAAPPHRTE